MMCDTGEARQTGPPSILCIPHHLHPHNLWSRRPAALLMVSKSLNSHLVNCNFLEPHRGELLEKPFPLNQVHTILNKFLSGSFQEQLNRETPTDHSDRKPLPLCSCLLGIQFVSMRLPCMGLGLFHFYTVPGCMMPTRISCQLPCPIPTPETEQHLIPKQKSVCLLREPFRFQKHLYKPCDHPQLSSL